MERYADVAAGGRGWTHAFTALDADARGSGAGQADGRRPSLPSFLGDTQNLLRRSAGRARTLALLVVLPLCFFLAFFNPATLQIGNVGWLIEGSDNGENALGAHAYWHDRLAGASLKTTLLNAPDGVPVLYTDSNPLLTVVAKPFAALMPADAQLVGPFVLLSLVLQAIFAWLLLRRRAPGPVALWAGVALLAFPPTLAHRYIHVNLMAHWTILAALCLFLDAKRSGRLAWWAPLIAVTALIHSYLLFMVAAIWASAMLARFSAGDRRERWATLAQGAVVVAMVAVLARWLGVGDQMSTATYGAFRMPIDALWNPGVGSYHALLPSHEYGPAGWFEGFQYLGAGGLLLVAAAAWIGWRHPAREGERLDSLRLRQMAPALIVLAMLAVAQLPLPAFAMALLDPIRASGRLFWPVGYVLILVSVLAVFRLPAPRAALVLVAIIAVQAFDLAGMASTIRARTLRAENPQPYNRTLDPRWDELVNRSRSIAFMPDAVTDDLDLFQEVSWRAIKLGRPVSNVYAARVSRASAQRMEAEQADFVHGRFVPGRLYVLLPGTALPAAARPNVLTLDDVTVIAPFPAR